MYCKNQQTGRIEYEGNTAGTGATAPEAVIQYALDNANRANVHIQPGSYTMSSGFAGIDLDVGETGLYMEGAQLTVPNAYSGYLFNIKSIGVFNSVNRLIGGRFDEAGTPVRNWDAIKFESSGGLFGASGCIIEGQYIRHAGSAIKLATDTNGWVNANTFRNIFIDTSTVAINFVHTGTYTDAASGCNTNMFDTITVNGSSTFTHGVKDVNGRRNMFLNCYVVDMTGAQITSNITANARNTQILGGTMTNLNFADLTPAGSETFIRDETMGDVARIRKTNNYNDFVTVSAPASPSSGIGRVYAKQIDANNDGLFIKVKKAGAITEVQIV
jgi:hypothetical protein